MTGNVQAVELVFLLLLLFVVASLAIFHFALPHGSGNVAALGLLCSEPPVRALLYG